jgi:hypothetical protein
MTKNRPGIVLMLLLLAVVAASAQPAAPGTAATVAPAEGFVPVAIWELHREGFPTARHAWVAGSEKMLRVSYDDGITWYAFRPAFVDTARGLLDLKVVVREELGRGEVAWRDAAGVTITVGADAKVTLPATATAAAAEVTLKLIEVKEVSPSELKPETPDADSAATDPEVIPMAGGGGGLGSCCVSCQGMRVCDCSVCIVQCHTSCCLGGCFCQHC